MMTSYDEQPRSLPLFIGEYVEAFSEKMPECNDMSKFEKAYPVGKAFCKKSCLRNY